MSVVDCHESFIIDEGKDPRKEFPANNFSIPLEGLWIFSILRNVANLRNMSKSFNVLKVEYLNHTFSSFVEVSQSLNKHQFIRNDKEKIHGLAICCV